MDFIVQAHTLKRNNWFVYNSSLSSRGIDTALKWGLQWPLTPLHPLKHPRTSDLHFLQINSTEMFCEWKLLKSIEELGHYSGHTHSQTKILFRYP